MHFFAVLVGLLAAIPSATAAPGAPALVARNRDKQYWDFQKSCTDVTLVGTHNATLRASCEVEDPNNQNPARLTTELDLNLCVGYDEEYQNIAFQPYGKFVNECDGSASLEDKNPDKFGHRWYLTATCWPQGNHNKPATTTQVWLNYGVSNEKGYLACSGGIGVLAP